MVKEIQIKKKVIQELTDKGWTITTFTRSQFGSCFTYTPTELLRGDDAFTILDGIAWRGNKKKFLQWTSKSNMSSRRKKIREFKKRYDLYGVVELWGYDPIKKTFKVEKI